MILAISVVSFGIMLFQDITSCEASAKRLSRNMVLCLNKLNENKDEKEVSLLLYQAIKLFLHILLGYLIELYQ